jgi:TolB protein
VTTGPFLDFRGKEARPGYVIEAGEVEFTIELASAMPVDQVEVLVNGKVLFEDEGLSSPGKKTYSGRVSLPAGGWIAARARGGATVWPSIDSYPFAHTGPIWIGNVGSLDLEAARASARELLAWLDVADKRLEEGYEGSAIPALKERFAEARHKLEALSR